MLLEEYVMLIYIMALRLQMCPSFFHSWALKTMRVRDSVYIPLHPCFKKEIQKNFNIPLSEKKCCKFYAIGAGEVFCALPHILPPLFRLVYGHA